MWNLCFIDMCKIRPWRHEDYRIIPGARMLPQGSYDKTCYRQGLPDSSPLDSRPHEHCYRSTDKFPSNSSVQRHRPCSLTHDSGSADKLTGEFQFRLVCALLAQLPVSFRSPRCWSTFRESQFVSPLLVVLCIADFPPQTCNFTEEPIILLLRIFQVSDDLDQANLSLSNQWLFLAFLPQATMADCVVLQVICILFTSSFWPATIWRCLCIAIDSWLSGETDCFGVCQCKSMALWVPYGMAWSLWIFAFFDDQEPYKKLHSWLLLNKWTILVWGHPVFVSTVLVAVNMQAWSQCSFVYRLLSVLDVVFKIFHIAQ